MPLEVCTFLNDKLDLFRWLNFNNFLLEFTHVLDINICTIDGHYIRLDSALYEFTYNGVENPSRASENLNCLCALSCVFREYDNVVTIEIKDQTAVKLVPSLNQVL